MQKSGDYLSKVVDFTAKYSLVPIKVYKINGEDVEPITRWSNATFLQRLEDFHDFKDGEIPDEFRELAAKFSKLMKEKVKGAVNKVRGKWSEGKWDRGDFELLSNGPRYCVLPILKNEQSQWRWSGLIAVIGGFFLEQTPNADEILSGLKERDISASRYVKRVLAEEFSEVPVIDKHALDKKALSIRRCLTAYITHFSDGTLKGEALESLILNIYRLVYKKDVWERYFNIIKDVAGEEGDEIIGIVFSIKYLDESNKLILANEKIIYGFSYVLYYSKDTNGIDDKVYIYDTEDEKKFYFQEELVSVDTPWGKLDIEEWKKKLLVQSFSNKLGSIVLFFNNKIKKKKYNCKLRSITKALESEIHEIIANTKRFKAISQNEFRERRMELMKDFIAYTPISEEKDFYFILDSLKNFGFRDIKFLIPAFYKEDGCFNDRRSGNYISDENLCERIYRRGEPFYINKGEHKVIATPISMGHRALGIIYTKSLDEESEVEQLDMLLRFTTISAPKKLLILLHKITDEIGRETAEINVNIGPSDVDIRYNKTGENGLAELIAQFFGAHAVDVFVYNTIRENWINVDTIGNGLITSVSNGKKWHTLLKKIIGHNLKDEKVIKILKIKGDEIFDGTRHNTVYIASSENKIGEEKDTIYVLLLIWSKFENYQLKRKFTLCRLT